MNNYVTVVFDSDEKAYDGLHALWKLDDRGDVTVHGAAVIHRDRHGRLDVATKDTDIGLRTILGMGIGALIGAFAGPIGSAMGIAGASSVAAASAAGIGAAAGGLTGATADTAKAAEGDEAGYEAQLDMRPGQAAVIADVSEDWTTPIDTEMQRLGGVVYRRPVSDVRRSTFLGDDYSQYLYPYDYEPDFAEKSQAQATH